MPARANSYVPTERIQVALFGMSVVRYTKVPDAKGWIVKKKADPHKPFGLWLLPEERDVVCQIYPTIPNVEEGKGAFIWGYPLRNLAISIHTCGTSGDRPKRLYRLTHDGQPHGGKKPRGHGLVGVDPFSFHVFFLKHLEWRCRNPSPFLSVTDDREKISHMYEIYQRRGYQNIKLITFRSYGPGWDHKKQRLYHVPTLAWELGRMPCMPFMDREFIIDGEIPHQSITKEKSLRPGNPRRPKRRRKPPTRKSTVRENKGEKRRRATAFKLRI
ncbi:hypothetical protein F5B21DRAFT_527057 [Xylaria acuta]|nr:hypothetical protein F5B21DRAFT_527057 [Xylaria acuta]